MKLIGYILHFKNESKKQLSNGNRYKKIFVCYFVIRCTRILKRERILDRINTELKDLPFLGYAPIGTHCKN